MLDSAYIDINEWLQYIEAENKQGNITAEECNAIMRKLSLTKFEGKYKILILWLPEYLGEQGNKLLKMIEEPPEDTLFLLCTDNTELILNTILSRCQLLRLNPLTDEQVSKALVEKNNLEPNHARHLAFMAEGNFIEALQLIGNQHNNDSELLLNWLRKCWIGNPAELMEWVEKDFSKLGRENQKQFLRFSLHFLRELLLKVVTGTDQLRLEPKETQVAANMAKLLDFEKISRISQLLNDNYYYIERNANPKILFLDASIKVHKIMRA
jgi:DNA polymerase-3 subunit delta'